MKKQLGILSPIVAALAYLYMIVVTARGTGDGLSLATFLLWGALSGIIAYAMWKKKCDPRVSLVYFTGAMGTAFVLLIKGRFGWSTMDSIVAALVVICMYLLLTKGEMPALIASVSGTFIAALPFIIMTWQAPEQSPIVPNTGFFLANTLSLIAAKSWKLEDSLYPTVNVGTTLLLVLPWLLR